VPPQRADRFKFEQHVIHSPEVYGIVIRPAVVYGFAGGNLGTKVNLLFKVVKEGKIVIEGNKLQRRPWVHIYDLTNAYFLAIEKYTVASGQVFDIGSSTPTFEEVYRRAAAVAGYHNVEVEERPVPQEKMYLNATIRTSCRKAKNLLDWTPNHLDVIDELEPLYESWKAHNSLKANL